MCGIFGFLKYQTVDLDTENAHMSLQHRGPDEKGVYQDENIFLAHHRLSIIDPSSGKQPMFDENKSLVLIYNGEIYNYKSLRKELIDKGYRFKTHSDTEVLVNLYKEFGEECLQKINGMFSFAIWDKDKRKLFCARDRLGIKPFYYADTDKAFFFASEIKALVNAKHISNEICLPAFFDFLSFQYISGPHTIFSQIKELEPGHSLTIKSGKLYLESYWNILEREETEPDKESALEHVENLLRQSIKDRLVSDVPFGVFLSGGIDSSLILSFMREFLGDNIKAFCVGFEDSFYNELPYAELCAKKYGAELNSFIFTHHDMLFYLTLISLLPTRLLSQPTFFPEKQKSMSRWFCQEKAGMNSFSAIHAIAP